MVPNQSIEYLEDPMSDNQPSKPQGEREITYRIGRKTGIIQSPEEKAKAASLRDKPLGWIAPPTQSEEVRAGAAIAGFLRRTLWRKAPEVPRMGIQLLLVLLPAASLTLIYYLITVLSQM
jgi:hypothetical protein